MHTVRLLSLGQCKTRYTNTSLWYVCELADYVLRCLYFFFSSRRLHTRSLCDWSSDVCSSDLRHNVEQHHVDAGPSQVRAGVMGSGIAAHLAGAGLDVLLLDIVPPDGKGGRNAFAAGGKEKAIKARPAAFFTTRDADRITVGNLEDDLAAAGQCDLVIEVVKEDVAVKRALF